MTAKLFLAFFLAISTASAGWPSFLKQAHHPRYEQLKPGDVVFQDTGGEQGEAVRAATKSDFTHCGVVFESKGKLYVLEAVQPVQVIRLDAWKARSKVFHARRLKDPKKLTPQVISKALTWGGQQLGKNYDFHFRWGNDSLYCSELVWKVYKKALGIQLCKPKSFQSYFLDDPVVRKVIRKRYGTLRNLPKNEPVVAPVDLAKSPLLVEVPRKRKKA